MSTIKCNFCAKSVGGSKVATGVLHYKKEHPKHPEYCYKQFGTTWDSTFDQLLLAQSLTNDRLNVAITQLEKVTEAYKQEAAIRNTLATKLNGIIMILEHKS